MVSVLFHKNPAFIWVHFELLPFGCLLKNFVTKMFTEFVEFMKIEMEITVDAFKVAGSFNPRNINWKPLQIWIVLNIH